MNIILFIILDVFNYPLFGAEKDMIGVKKDIIGTGKDVIYYVPTVNTGLIEDCINLTLTLRIGRINGEIKFHTLINECLIIR
jgi:hypothetical protein